MPTVPDLDEEPQSTRERVTRAIVTPIEKTPRTLAVLALAAGTGSFAPDLFGAVAAMSCVVAAWDLARKR